MNFIQYSHTYTHRYTHSHCLFSFRKHLKYKKRKCDLSYCLININVPIGVTFCTLNETKPKQTSKWKSKMEEISSISNNIVRWYNRPSEKKKYNLILRPSIKIIVWWQIIFWFVSILLLLRVFLLLFYFFHTLCNFSAFYWNCWHFYNERHAETYS